MLFKSEYEAILALLQRVEIRGLNEARAITVLGHKLEQKIATWVHGDKPEPGPGASSKPTNGNILQFPEVHAVAVTTAEASIIPLNKE